MNKTYTPFLHFISSFKVLLILIYYSHKFLCFLLFCSSSYISGYHFPLLFGTLFNIILRFLLLIFLHWRIHSFPSLNDQDPLSEVNFFVCAPFVYVYMYICMCTYVCICMCIYVCTCVCMCVYIYVYIG